MERDLGRGKDVPSRPILYKKICLYLRQHTGCAMGTVPAVELDESFVEKAFDLSLEHLKTENAGRQEDMQHGWVLVPPP